jgi:hypothetical protein
VNGESHGYRPSDLDPGSADLAVALREVEVADRDERARDMNGQADARSGHELPDVEIAADLAWGDRAETAGGRRRQRTLPGRVCNRRAGLGERTLAPQDLLEQLV